MSTLEFELRDAQKVRRAARRHLSRLREVGVFPEEVERFEQAIDQVKAHIRRAAAGLEPPLSQEALAPPVGTQEADQTVHELFEWLAHFRRRAQVTLSGGDYPNEATARRAAELAGIGMPLPTGVEQTYRAGVLAREFLEKFPAVARRRGIGAREAARLATLLAELEAHRRTAESASAQPPHPGAPSGGGDVARGLTEMIRLRRYLRDAARAVLTGRPLADFRRDPERRARPRTSMRSRIAGSA